MCIYMCTNTTQNEILYSLKMSKNKQQMLHTVLPFPSSVLVLQIPLF